MKLFEVTKWGHNGNPNDADTNYLVSANDYQDAVACVERCCEMKADMVSEIGTTTAKKLTILRGPYIAFAINSGGWKCWRRYTNLEGILTEFEEM